MPKPDHTLGAIRALVAVPEDRLELYGVSTGAWADIVRHLVDVVERQHSRIAADQWNDFGRMPGSEGHGACPECEGKPNTGHAEWCKIGALLRETA